VSGGVWGGRPPGDTQSGGVWEGRPAGAAQSGETGKGRPAGEAAPDGVAPDALRQLVREVLRDVLPGLADRPGSPPPTAPPVRKPAAPSAPPTSDPPTSEPASRPAAPASRPAAPSAPPAAPPTSDPGPPRLSGPTRAGGPARAAGGYESGSRPGLEVRPVRLATDEELHEFVLHVIALADNPKRRRDLLAGRLRFTLGPAGAPESPADHRIDKGAVTERAVQAAASAGARLILGPRAVLTPLARDRARALGVPIEKER
jgi:hypothetical protein